jgi:mannose-6-phosphate isomerase-like protein (cupin superfamily)
VRAALVDTTDIPAETLASGATVRPVLDVAGAAGGRLARRLVTVPAGGTYAGTAGPAGELWFVTSGRGTLAGPGPSAVPVAPEHGIALPPGTPYRLAAEPARQTGDLIIDAVTLPAPPGTAPSGTAPSGTAPPGSGPAGADASVSRVADLRECAVEVTGDRQFRVLFGPGTGYPAATQFVGEIPPGRAPDHQHAYDELVLILAGEGVVHLDGTAHPLRPGSCVHLPPGQRHCLENTGSATLRVLGVFHPGGSPAAKTP